MHLGEEKPVHVLESSFVEKDLHVLMNNKSNISQQHTPVAKVANQIWVYINKIVASRLTEVVLPPCSATARPQLSTVYSLWLWNKYFGCTEASPEEDHCYNRHAGAHDIWGKAEKAEFVQI